MDYWRKIDRNMKTLSILIAAFDEKNTIKTLLDQVIDINLPNIQKEIIVVESGSTDGTKELVQEYEANHKVRAFYEKKPRGKGHAIRWAMKEATGDIILIQDADLEYFVSDYPALLEPLQTGRAKFVLGSRHLGMKDWKIRKFITNRMYGHTINVGHLIYTTLFNLLYGTRLTDPATMFKVYFRNLLDVKNLKSNYFELDWEIVAKLIKSGHPPVEVPVGYVSRTFEEGKKIRFLRDGFLVLFAIIWFRFFD